MACGTSDSAIGSQMIDQDLHYGVGVINSDMAIREFPDVAAKNPRFLNIAKTIPIWLKKSGESYPPC